MKKKTLIIALISLITFFSLPSFPQDYKQDSLSVRAILDSNGLETTSVESVTDTMAGRIFGVTISDKGIYTLPPEIGNLTFLAWLDLSANNLRKLPPEIGKSNVLIFLDLSANILRDLPPEIGNHKGLRELDLSNNNLTNLPESIVNLTPSDELNLGYNNLDPYSLSDELYAWASKYDPDWHKTQTIPIIYMPDYNYQSQQNLLIQNDQTFSIKYYLPSSGKIRLDVLDLRGRIVANLVDSYKQSGTYSVNWGSHEYSSGMYYLKLSIGNNTLIQNAVIMK